MTMNSRPRISDSAKSCKARFIEYLNSPCLGATRIAKDQLARFNLWTSNIGVFAPDTHASLDKRLGESSQDEIRQMILRLLAVIDKELQQAKSVAASPPLKIPPRSESNIIIADFDSDTSESSSSSNSLLTDFSSEFRLVPASLKALLAVRRAVSQLHLISSAIRKASQRDHDLKASKFVEKDPQGREVSAAFEGFARGITKARHSAANNFLLERLSQAMITRRRKLMYTRQRREKQALAENHGSSAVPEKHRNQKLTNKTPPKPALETASNYRPTSQTVISTQPSGTEPSKLDAKEFRMPSPSIQASTARTQSRAGFGKLDYPPPPKIEQNHKSVECPYCFNILASKILSGMRWPLHVKPDLEAYVCLYEPCPQPLKLYKKCEDWLRHLQLNHGSYKYHCSATKHEPLEFDSAAEYDNHMRKVHAGTFTEAQLPTLSTDSAQPVAEIFDTCPLCNGVPDEVVESDDVSPLDLSQRLQGHIEKHLISLATLSVTWQPFGPSDTSTASEQPSNEALLSVGEANARHELKNSVSLEFVDNGATDIMPPPEDDENHESGAYGASIDWSEYHTNVAKSQPRSQDHTLASFAFHFKTNNDLDLIPTENFIYEPLEQTEIRLVKILPAVGIDRPIRVHLMTSRIDDLPDYQVLSYTWGNPIPQINILCNGLLLAVSDNLHSALLALRKSQRETTFWIDAICINQDDDKEKNRMVALFIPFAVHANYTILWVGTEDSDTHFAFELILKLVSARRDYFEDTLPSHLNQHQIISASALRSYRKLLSSHSPMIWQPLNDLISRTVFERAWTSPDIVFSQRLLVCCGSFTISWDEFCYGLEAYVCCSFPNELRHPATQAILGMNSLRKQRLAKDRVVTPDDILETLRDLKASDPRDKVYATLGIIDSLGSKIFTNEPSPQWIQPDYSNQYKEFCIDTATALNSNNAFISTRFSSLSMVEDEWPQPRHLPSWVPDWKLPRHIYRLNTMQNTFLASRGKRSDLIHYDQSSMTLTGCMVGIIDTIGKYLPPRHSYDKYNTSSASNSVFLQWFSHAAIADTSSRIRRADDRPLLGWVETILAKGCSLWEEFEDHDPASLIAIARLWLDVLKGNQVATEEIQQFHAACLPSYGRRLGITERGHFCLIPRYALRGDMVCIPFGSKVPFVFRKVEGTEYYLNIGECYVHGAMNGEALAWDNIEEKEFVLG